MARIPKPLDGEREARLLRVAAEAFLADGFERASLNRIIEDAGIAKSSFYHYFTDKRALYDHLLETLRTHLTARLARMDLDALTRETFWSELDRTLRGLGAAPDDSPARLALARLFHANSDLDEGFRRLRAKLLGSLDAVLRRGRELGAVRADLPIGLVVEVAAGWLFGIDRWAAARRVTEAAEPTAIAADRALRTLYTALAAPCRDSTSSDPTSSGPAARPSTKTPEDFP